MRPYSRIWSHGYNPSTTALAPLAIITTGGRLNRRSDGTPTGAQIRPSKCASMVYTVLYTILERGPGPRALRGCAPTRLMSTEK